MTIDFDLIKDVTTKPIKNAYGYIYITIDHKHNKYYVGKKENPVFDSTYFGSGLMITRICKKRPQDLTCIAIDWATSKQELNEKEKHWIAQLHCLDDVDLPMEQRKFYNIMPGGDGGRLSGESLKSMKTSRLGKCCGDKNPNFRGKALTDNGRERLRIAMLGKHLSEETKRKIGEKSKLFRHTKESKEKLRQAHLGSKLSEETKAKISRNRKGKMLGKEHPMHGTHLTDTQKQNLRDKNLYGNSPRAKKVYKFTKNMLLITEYQSRSHTEIDGYKSSKISYVCNLNDRSDDTTYIFDDYIFTSNKDYLKKENIKVLGKARKEV